MSEAHHQRAHTAPVVMDIGADMGSLIIYTDAARCGDEIEISPVRADDKRTHTDVAERRVNGRTLYAAVYLPMPAGDYTIWGPNPTQPTRVTILPDVVTEVDWR